MAIYSEFSFPWKMVDLSIVMLVYQKVPDTTGDTPYYILQNHVGEWYGQSNGIFMATLRDREREIFIYISFYILYCIIITYNLEKVKCLAAWCGYPHQNCKNTCQTTQPRCKKWCRLETKVTAQATESENTPMKKTCWRAKLIKTSLFPIKSQTFFFSIYHFHPCFVC